MKNGDCNWILGKVMIVVTEFNLEKVLISLLKYEVKISKCIFLKVKHYNEHKVLHQSWSTFPDYFLKKSA